ncbi:MAG: formate--phosphoribosylaminoimidazolecarboxamide ligase [Candidatus Bathyarchaeota archaeon]|jgi:5-formaminoimidazole-4-carboxamide-1-(beta)-D-ribofuranosyl 5'-monophosphate synthetase|nr:MAG: formate--phosphoribosylaminoimidazolecarboxamide ligase [Candidatus Bathyarchaeota archaeon]
MIEKTTIDRILSDYDKERITIATACSHSALQIFHGAKKEGYRTLGICKRDRKHVYDSFPYGKPDKYIIVDEFSDVLLPRIQEELVENNSIIVPHGSFVEYVGPKELEAKFCVPMFGNRKTLEWERDREKQRKWLVKAGLVLPEAYDSIPEDGRKTFVKLSGAKGGRGFFTVASRRELERKLMERVKQGIIPREEARNLTFQEFIPGVRYYSHYFYSLLEDKGPGMKEGRVELLSMDKRIEPIDESYRGLPKIPEEFFDYTVTGNQPIVIRESFLPAVMEMGINTVNVSKTLFPPGMLGAFCLETIYNPRRGFTVFEISARIVAGTNLFPEGSPYSCYLFNEPMSTGRRIAREIRTAAKTEKLTRIIY